MLRMFVIVRFDSSFMLDVDDMQKGLYQAGHGCLAISDLGTPSLRGLAWGALGFREFNLEI